MRQALRELGKMYAAPQWHFYLGGTIALIITNIIVLEIPLLAKKIIDTLASRGELKTLSSVAISIILLGLSQVIIRTTSRILIFWPGRALEANLKADVFYRILIAPLVDIISYSVGELTSRLNNDVTQLRIFFAFGALQVLNVIFISIFTISKMASIDSTLTALAISPMLLMLVLTKVVMPHLYKSMRENTEALGRLTAKVSEAFSQVHVVQMMNAVPAISSRLEPDNFSIFQSNSRTIWLRTLTWPVMTVLIGLSQFATLTWGGKQIMAGQLTVGDIMAFNIYIGMLTFPFASLGIILNVYQRAKPAAERIQMVKTITPETVLTAPSKSFPKERRHLLEVDNLSFRWPDGRSGVENISFTVDPGEQIGVFGKIGSGKSTLFNLLTKLYPIAEGQAYLDGKDLQFTSPEYVRNRIGYAQQTPLLFSESIKSNMCLGYEDSNVPLSALRDAARQADILDDIEKFPESWDTLIGERGIKLSGGQKQRLALARLLLRKNKIIILDDVLAAVDHETENKLIKALLGTKAALIIASHRISILKPCHKIMVLDGGKMIAFGPYEQVRHFIESAPSTTNARGPQ
jgi:ATP-binding cassette subfamily B multidrug efflux pump